MRRAGGVRRISALDAAIEVFADRGCEHTRFADVSAICGVAISTLQYYFGSREDMVIEALRRFIEREVQATEAIADAEPHPGRRLVALLSRPLDITQRDRRIQLEFWRATLRDDELRAFCDSFEARFQALYLQVIKDGCEQGIFHTEQDPHDIVDVMKAVCCGLSHPWTDLQARPSNGFRQVWFAQVAATLGVSVLELTGELVAT